MDALRERIPEYAKDLRLNLGSLEKSEALTPVQLWGTLVASAHACRNPTVVAEIEAAAAAHLDENALSAARTANAIMAMNNVYYRFVHLASNAEYGKLPARLRMQALANPSVPTLDFELWCLAVSAINGCGACVDSHERKLRSEGATAQAIQDAVRAAAVVHGVANVVDPAKAAASAG